MQKKQIFVVLASFSLFLIIGFLSFAGFFAKVEIQEKSQGPFVLVYEDHKGDYKGTAKIQDRIYHSLLNEHKIETKRGFGIYYDNPKTVPTSELRSIAGCILESSDLDKIEYLRQNNFKIRDLPATDYVYTEFPYTSSLSILGGIFVVYPKLEEYIKEKKLPNNEIMEIYDVPNKKILYLMRK